MHSLSRVATLAFVAFWLRAVPVFAQIETGLDQTAKTAFGGKVPAQRDLALIIGYFIRQALTFIGVIFLVLTVYAGFLWMTAGGNEKNIEKAKAVLSSAVIGLVVIAAGYAITSFVLQTITTATTLGT